MAKAKTLGGVMRSSARVVKCELAEEVVVQTTQQVTSVVEAILKRQSVRKFLPVPVAPALIREVLDVARHAPSWSNSQPWEVAVAAGRRLAAVKDGLAAKSAAGVPPNPDVPSPRFPEPYLQRRREGHARRFAIVGITRETVELRAAYDLSIQRFCEAPVGLVLYIDRGLGPWSMLDVGAFMQTIMLAATASGLGTCPLAAIARYPDVLRQHLGIPETKQILCGIAVGYADGEAPINRYRSDRVPLDEMMLWCWDETP